MENEDRFKKPKPSRIVLVVTYAIVLFLLLSRIDKVWETIRWVLNIFTPLFLGVALAFIFHLPMNFFQYKLLKSWEHSNSRILRRLWRGVSMLLSYLCVLIVLGGLLSILLPRAFASIVSLASNFSNYITNFQSWLDGFLTSLSLTPSASAMVSEVWQQAVDLLQKLLGTVAGRAVSFTVSITTGVTNFLFALMFSGFMLYNHEKLFSQFKRLSTAILGPRRTRRLCEVVELVDNVFGRFILGQTTEALILGTLCFVGMSLFGMDYAVLISCVIAVTALVPILGAWIGTVPCALILVMIEPAQALWFLLFIIVLQQLEGDFIYPHVVGNAVGLPGLWVLASIIVGGGLFGVWGMLLGTPCAAVCYKMIAEWLRGREQKELKGR